uniref:Phospholysine phosphohistidine inorganic pyrophosphate phosphatase n=1 Tax=Panagrolaimus sp. JU765 TaxID=591449 RepID=A0AC34RFG3_9BILA
MIGDDVQDDINGSLALGFKAILVKTGKYCSNDEEKVNNHRENFKLKSSVTEALEGILQNDGKTFFE